MDICMNCGKTWGGHQASHPVTGLNYCQAFVVDIDNRTHWRPAQTEKDADNARKLIMLVEQEQPK